MLYASTAAFIPNTTLQVAACATTQARKKNKEPGTMHARCMQDQKQQGKQVADQLSSSYDGNWKQQLQDIATVPAPRIQTPPTSHACNRQQ
jgi:hypothetical protein